MVFPLVGALINGATATLNVASGTFGAWAALHSDQHQAEIAQDIQGHSVRLQRSMALREDIRDLRKLEVETVLTSMTVGSIMLGCCFAVFTEGYPPPDAISAWADIWMFNISWSICLTFLSIWLASVYQVCVSKFARALLLEEYRIYLPSENEIRNAGGPSLWDRVKALQALPLEVPVSTGNTPEKTDCEDKNVDEACERLIKSGEVYAETQVNINEHFKEQINRYIPFKEYSDKYLRAGGTALIAAVVCTLGARLDTTEWFRPDVFTLCVFAAPPLFSVLATAFYHARETDSTRPRFGDFVTLTKEKSKKHIRSARELLKAPCGSRSKLQGTESKSVHRTVPAERGKAPLSTRTFKEGQHSSRNPIDRDSGSDDSHPQGSRKSTSSYQPRLDFTEPKSVPLETQGVDGGVFGVTGSIRNVILESPEVDDDSSVVNLGIGCLPLENCAASVPPISSRNRFPLPDESHTDLTTADSLRMPARMRRSTSDLEEGRVPGRYQGSASVGDDRTDAPDRESIAMNYARLRSQTTGAILVPTEPPCSKDSQRVKHTMRHFHKLLWILVVATLVATLIHIIIEAVWDEDSDIARLEEVPLTFPPFFEPISCAFTNGTSFYILSSYRLLRLNWDRNSPKLSDQQVFQLPNAASTMFVTNGSLHILQKDTGEIVRFSDTSTVSAAPANDVSGMTIIGDLAFLWFEVNKHISVLEMTGDKNALAFGQLTYTIGHPCEVIDAADATGSDQSPRLMVLLSCKILILWEISSGTKLTQWHLDENFEFTSIAVTPGAEMALLTASKDFTQKIFRLSL
ncbi:hypothetical protein FOL47_009621 [Perkinsus chesapeaki]|uniref:Uncharacterized protein n=1 Tax=Perkinsus chesapeaki TaxID=330153 RepID=A0A7J6L785_PERCH|nr:hypothetical protein FOL47_009621 [Perkinsus chesapeaki]